MNRTIFFLIISFCAIKLSAQHILSFQHINVEDGLSQSSVYNIYQDSHGFMWFATGDGLNRYDGKDFIIYKSRISDTTAAQFKDRNINSCIFEDKNNRLWMSTEAGISYFDYVHSKFYNAVNSYSIAFGLDSNYIWSYAAQRGVYRLNIFNLQTVYYSFDDQWQNSKTDFCYIYKGVVSGDHIFLADKAGLLSFNKKSFAYTRLIENGKLNSITVLHNGDILLCSRDGIYLYDTTAKTAKFIFIKSISDKQVKWVCAAEDSAANAVYIGAQNSGAICKLDLGTNKYEFINIQNSSIYCLLIDHSRNLWIGTEGNGVYKLDIKSPKFYCYTPYLPVPGSDNGLMVKSIYRDSSGPVWIGSFNSGLIKYDISTQKQQKVSLPFPSESKLIGCIMKDSAGRMIITVGARLVWFDHAGEKILSQFDLHKEIARTIDEPQVYSLVEWKKDHYLAATNVGVFSFKYENGKAQKVYHFFSDTTLYSWIYNLYKWHGDTIYIGKRNRNGYAKVKVLNDTALLLLDKGFDHLAIRNFYKCSNKDILWMASEKGLIAYDERTKKYKVFDEASGLKNSCVYAILSENDSSLWISTNRGLANLKVGYGIGTDIKADIISYTSKEGLQSNEFNTGAYFKGSDGTLYFGGILGINWFDPQKIRPNLFKPEPVVTKIFINDKIYAYDTAAYIHSLVLSHTSNTISLSLASLDYTRQENNEFAYKLDGFEKEWTYTTNNKVRYSNLPPGEYTFLVKASNNDGIWNEDPFMIKISIKPPYWQTWWFRMLIALTIVIITIVIVRYYIKQKVSTKTRLLEQQKALYVERLRISKDVHDDLGSGLSKIALMAEMAQKKVEKNIPLSKDIRHISAISLELVDNMRDLIWVLNPENTTLDQLVARIREYCVDYFEQIPLKITLHFPDNVPVLRITKESQRNIFLTVKEALNNSIKHANAYEIIVSLKICTDKFSISISDDGKGFDISYLKKGGNGLRNMKQRIESIGGVFNIQSSSKGTLIDIVIPIERLFVRKLPL